MANSSKYTYTVLSQLGNHVGEKVNVFGVVIDDPADPVDSNATHRVQKIQICDESIGLNSSITCTVKIPKINQANTYVAPKKGNIVRLHRMRVSTAGGRISGILYQPEDMLEICIQDGSVTFMTMAMLFSRDGQLEKRAKDLHSWFLSQPRPLAQPTAAPTDPPVPVPVPIPTTTDVTTFSEITRNSYVNLHVEILAMKHNEVMYPSQMVLRVWDATKPRGEPLISNLGDVYINLGEMYRQVTRGYEVDIIVYDDHIDSVKRFHLLDRVLLRNVQVKFASQDMKFWLNRGGSYGRGIYTVEDERQKNILDERINVLFDSEAEMDILEIDDLSDIEMSEEDRENIEVLYTLTAASGVETPATQTSLPDYNDYFERIPLPSESSAQSARQRNAEDENAEQDET